MRRRVDVKRVCHVDTNAILYLDGLGRPKTAWLRYDGARLRIAIESGWPAEPGADIEAQLAA